MIFKLFFMLWSCIILTIFQVNSYVLFAANMDDIRGLASKIMPNNLATQLAYMAEKNGDLNYRIQANEESESSNENSSEETDSESSEGYTVNTRGKKMYKLQDEIIDLDELVKRVKERLEKDYTVTPEFHKAASKIKGSGLKMKNNAKYNVKNDGKIEDYYYKDEVLNFDQEAEYENALKKPRQKDFKMDKHAYDVMDQYQGEIIDYNQEIYDGEYATENVENSKYVQENQNNKNSYKQVTVNLKYKNVVTAKENVRDGVNSQKRKFDEHGNVIPLNAAPRIKFTSKKVPKEHNYPKQPDEFVQKPKIKITQPKESEVEEMYPEYYEDKIQETQTEADGNLFKEIDMLKTSNDSYEDYVTPKKDNIFDSGEPTQTLLSPKSDAQKTDTEDRKIPKRRPNTEPKESDVEDEVIKPPVKQTAFTANPEFIRAKTASMWYSDPNIENYDDSTKKVSMNAKLNTPKKALRTMFPTKMHVKISSPSYFAKLPAVAEKYNFDEPIPEKDREPEKIKHFGNPPASINKKVKI